MTDDEYTIPNDDSVSPTDIQPGADLPGADLDEREVLQYHSKFGDVRRGVVSGETVVAEREIPPDGAGPERSD